MTAHVRIEPRWDQCIRLAEGSNANLIAWSHACDGNKNEMSIPQKNPLGYIMYKVVMSTAFQSLEKSFEQQLLPFQHQAFLLKLGLLLLQ